MEFFKKVGEVKDFTKLIVFLMNFILEQFQKIVLCCILATINDVFVLLI